MAKPDYYDVLGVKKGATPEEIKAAYRKQALAWHPDRHREDKETAEKKFKEVNEAYQVLSDPQKKSTYDQFGADAFAPGSGAARGANPFGQGFGGGPFTYTYSTNGQQAGNPFSGFDFGDPFDIFAQFFGGESPMRERQRIPRYSIALDFMEAAKGTEKEVSINGKKRTIKIPAGVDEGSRINFNDFILSIEVKPDKTFERDGADIYIKVEIPYSTAVLGGDIEVPTIDKKVTLRVRAGTASGTMMRLKDKGVVHLRGNGHGDQYVRLIVKVPEKLSYDQKKIVESLRSEGL